MKRGGAVGPGGKKSSKKVTGIGGTANLKRNKLAIAFNNLEVEHNDKEWVGSEMVERWKRGASTEGSWNSGFHRAMKKGTVKSVKNGLKNQVPQRGVKESKIIWNYFLYMKKQFESTFVAFLEIFHILRWNF